MTRRPNGGSQGGVARVATALGLLLALTLRAGLAGADPKPQEKRDEPRVPRERDYSQIYDLFNHTLVRPTTRMLDGALLLRKLTHTYREAENVDASDQVRLPSTWWQPRVGYCQVTVDQMLHGPGKGEGPAPGRWKITKAKTQGLTPGFQIKDAKGDNYIVKFDPTTYPEMATACDAIGSHLFWAAGYNVPENTVVVFSADSLDIADNATYVDSFGNKKRFTREHLNDLLTRVAQRRDGLFRAMASRFLKGKPLGPFKYGGRRNDDPEDLIPHEHRRELRGLWAMAAWVNHADVRGPNSLDMYVEDGGRKFVRHYLIDFGSILGSSAVGPHEYATGTEYYVDGNVILREVTSLGLVPFEWEPVVDPRLPSVGFIESKVFDPVHWRPDFPNPAFDERTLRDVRWGARIVAGFTDEMIRAAVNLGHYSSPAAADYVVRVLIERRDKIAHAWLGPGATGNLNPE